MWPGEVNPTRGRCTDPQGEGAAAVSGPLVLVSLRGDCEVAASGRGHPRLGLGLGPCLGSGFRMKPVLGLRVGDQSGIKVKAQSETVVRVVSDQDQDSGYD